MCHYSDPGKIQKGLISDILETMGGGSALIKLWCAPTQGGIIQSSVPQMALHLYKGLYKDRSLPVIKVQAGSSALQKLDGGRLTYLWPEQSFVGGIYVTTSSHILSCTAFYDSGNQEPFQYLDGCTPAPGSIKVYTLMSKVYTDGEVRYTILSDRVAILDGASVAMVGSVSEWLARRHDKVDLILNALQYNRCVAAFIMTVYPTIFEEDCGLGPGVRSIRKELLACLSKVPELADFFPRDLVMENLEKIRLGHRIPRSFYNTPESFSALFFTNWRARHWSIPWNYAEEHFGHDAVNALVNMFVKVDPLCLWATPNAANAKKRHVNAWINAAQKRVSDVAASGRPMDFDTDEYFRNPDLRRGWLPNVYNPDQFKRIICAVGRLPLRQGNEPIPMSWWTPSLVQMVAEQLPSLRHIPRAMLTDDIRRQWVEKNPTKYLKGYPNRTPKSDMLAFHSFQTYQVDDMIKLFQEMSVRDKSMVLKLFGHMTGPHHLSKFLPLLDDSLLCDKEIVGKICHVDWRNEIAYEFYQKRGLHRVLYMLDEGYLKGILFKAIPEERRTDDLCRRTHISNFYLFTDTVRSERRVEHEIYHDQQIRMRDYGGYYRDECMYDYDRVDPAQLMSEMERGYDC